MKTNLKILLLEDNASDVKLLDRALSKNFEHYQLKVIETREEYLAELKKEYDIVISDYALPAFDGMEALKIRNRQRPFLPFIITTGSTNEPTAVQCMKEGADDYIIKEHITRIGEAVKRAIALKKSEQEKQTAFRTVQHLNRILKAIRNINQLITRVQNESELIQQACDMFTAEQSYRAAWIALLDEKGKLGRYNAFSGFSEKDFQPMTGFLAKGNRPVCFQMAEKSKTPVHIRHNENILKNCPIGKLFISSSALCRSLTYQNKKLGFITVSIPDDVELNDEEKELFSEVTNDLAYALFNIQVEKENREAALRQKVLFDIAHAAVEEEEPDTFLSRVFEIIKKVMNFHHGYVALHDPKRHVYTFPIQYKTVSFGGKELPDSRKGIIEYVRRKQKPVLLTAPELQKMVREGRVEQIGPIHALWMGIPLYNKNRFIGVMAFMNNDDPAAFSQKDRDLLHFISQQLALFIERKEAVIQLKASNERYKNLMVQASDAIILCNREGDVVEVNEKACESLGYTEEALLRMKAFDLVPERLAKIQKAQYWDHFSLNDTVEFETVFLRKDQTEFPVEITSGIVRIGDEEMVLSIARDITARKKAEERIRQLTLGVEQSPASIVITDLEGRIQYVNKKFTEVSGYSRQEVLGQNPRILKSGKMPDRLYKELWDTVSSGKEWRGEMINRRKDQTLYWELVSISPVKDDEGKITHYIAVKEDITERKEMEAELRKAKQKAEESNRLKSEFLANMSHEIRTPMNGIIGFASLLEDEELPAETRRNYVQIIQNSTRQLLKIIDEILEVSKLQTHQVEKVVGEANINEMLLGCFSELDQLAKSKNIALYLKKGLPDDAALVRLDKSKIHKILHNLLENALKFTQEGYVELGYTLKGKNLEFYVKDTGIGISPEAQELIFETFSQEDKGLSRISEGLGLGLSIVKGNVDLLGGTIRVTSEKGKGSVFFVEIPYEPVHAGLKLPKEKTDGGKKPLSILVVEDEEVNYQYLEILLKKYQQDIHVWHAVSGREAVDVCSHHPEIKLVLMDLKLPGMDGLEATRQIKARHPEQVVIAQTAYTALENQEEAKKAGCNAFLRKPTRKADLFRILDKYLKNKDK